MNTNLTHVKKEKKYIIFLIQGLHGQFIARISSAYQCTRILRQRRIRKHFPEITGGAANSAGGGGEDEGGGWWER